MKTIRTCIARIKDDIDKSGMKKELCLQKNIGFTDIYVKQFDTLEKRYQFLIKYDPLKRDNWLEII